MSTRLLGVQIANGYSPEAQVFSQLLAHASSEALEPHILHHQWRGDAQSAERFQQVSGASVQTMDFGWCSIAAHRSLPAKARARLRFLAALPRALRLARHINPDLIYSGQQLWDCQAATYLARKLKKPQVIHLHYIIGPWLHRPVLERLLTCAHVIAVSEFIRDDATRHGVRLEKVITIRNTVAVAPPPQLGVRAAVREELRIAQDAPVLGIVARLDPDKGQADTLRAFAQTRRRHPGLHLLVVGDLSPWHPAYAGTLHEMARDLGVAEWVHFLGRRSDVPRLLAAMDIFVHPSRREPFGLAMAEACAAGLPVLGYAEGGACEIVLQGVTGILAPPGDIDMLGAAMTSLLDNPQTGRKMGLAGRERMAQHFRPEEAGRQLAELLTSISAQHNGV